MKFNLERAVHLSVIVLCLIAAAALVGSQLVERPAPALETWLGQLDAGGEAQVWKALETVDPPPAVSPGAFPEESS